MLRGSGSFTLTSETGAKERVDVEVESDMTGHSPDVLDDIAVRVRSLLVSTVRDFWPAETVPEVTP